MRRVLRFTPFTSRTLYITRKLTSISFGNRRRKQVIYIPDHQENKTELTTQTNGRINLSRTKRSTRIDLMAPLQRLQRLPFNPLAEKKCTEQWHTLFALLSTENEWKELLIGLHTRVFPFKIIQFPKNSGEPATSPLLHYGWRRWETRSAAVHATPSKSSVNKNITISFSFEL